MKCCKRLVRASLRRLFDEQRGGHPAWPLPVLPVPRRAISLHKLASSAGAAPEEQPPVSHPLPDSELRAYRNRHRHQHQHAQPQLEQVQQQPQQLGPPDQTPVQQGNRGSWGPAQQQELEQLQHKQWLWENEQQLRQQQHVEEQRQQEVEQQQQQQQQQGTEVRQRLRQSQEGLALRVSQHLQAATGS